MSAEFKRVNEFCFWSQKVLPLVYDDSLSYAEVLYKMTNVLNELIKNNNELPDYISELIEKYITSGDIEKVVQNVVSNFILNVKYPPNGITPATGDGSADDTEALQGCIDYAYNQGGGVVYIPYGKYLVNSLTMRDGVSLIGFDRYSTILVLKGGATNSLINGTNISDFSVMNITLDGNATNQVNKLTLMNLEGDNYLLSNMLCKDSDTLVIINASGHTQINNVVFDNGGTTALTLSGETNAQMSGVIFNNSNKNRKNNVVTINTNGGKYDFISDVECESACVINGNNNYIVASIRNATNDYVNNGRNNTTINQGVNETISPENLILNPTNPLTYRKPSVLNKYFKSIPFKDTDDNVYNVLVDNGFKFKEDSSKIIAFTPDLLIPDSGGTTTAIISDSGVIVNDSPTGTGYEYVVSQMKDAGITKINAFTLSHYDADHYQGLLKFKNDFDMSECVLYLPLTTTKYPETTSALTAIKNAYPDNTIIYPTDNSKYTIGNIEVTFTNCGGGLISYYDSVNADYNNYSMVSTFKVDGIMFMHCGDIEKTAMDKIVTDGTAKHVDIMTAPHHGVTPSDMCEAIAKIWNPKYVIVSANYGQINDSGLRSATLAMLHYLNAVVYSTLINTNGITFTISDSKISEKNKPYPLSPFAVEATQTIYVDENFSGSVRTGDESTPYTSLKFALQTITDRIKTKIVVKNISPESSIQLFMKNNVEIDFSNNTISYLAIYNSYNVTIKNLKITLVPDVFDNINLSFDNLTLPGGSNFNTSIIKMNNITVTGTSAKEIGFGKCDVLLTVLTGNFSDTAFYFSQCTAKISVSVNSVTCSKIYRSYASVVNINGNVGTITEIQKYCKAQSGYDVPIFLDYENNKLGFLSANNTLTWLTNS